MEPNAYIIFAQNIWQIYLISIYQTKS